MTADAIQKRVRNLEPWLFTKARNLSIDRMRARARETGRAVDTEMAGLRREFGLHEGYARLLTPSARPPSAASWIVLREEVLSKGDPS